VPLLANVCEIGVRIFVGWIAQFVFGEVRNYWYFLVFGAVIRLVSIDFLSRLGIGEVYHVHCVHY
jgi:hypothetical protein